MDTKLGRIWLTIRGTNSQSHMTLCPCDQYIFRLKFKTFIFLRLISTKPCMEVTYGRMLSMQMLKSSRFFLLALHFSAFYFFLTKYFFDKKLPYVLLHLLIAVAFKLTSDSKKSNGNIKHIWFLHQIFQAWNIRRIQIIFKTGKPLNSSGCD